MSGKLILMMGVPGSGKTTWCRGYIINEYTADDNPYVANVVYISRDDIRFSLLNDNDNYFAKEDEVFKLFTDYISKYLNMHWDVFADATHLTAEARKRVIENLTIKPESIEVMYLNTPLEVAIERNNKRTGRALVPEKVIRKMYQSIQYPTKAEGISKFCIVNEDDSIIEYELEGADKIVMLNNIMDEIMKNFPKEGDWARGEKGELAKVTSVFNTTFSEIMGIDEKSSVLPYAVPLNIEPYFNSKIKNIKTNLIDLIEEGDFVNGFRVEKIRDEHDNIILGYSIKDNKEVLDILPIDFSLTNIREIITHEEGLKYTF